MIGTHLGQPVGVWSRLKEAPLNWESINSALVVLYAATLPLESGATVTAIGSIPRIVGIGVLLTGLLAYWRRFTIAPGFGFIIAFWAFAVLSVIWTKGGDRTWDRLGVEWTHAAALFILVNALWDKPKIIAWSIFANMAAAGGIAILSFRRLLTASEVARVSAFGTGTESIFGMILLTGGVVAGVLLIQGKGGKWWPALAIAALAVWTGVFASGLRGAMLAIIAAYVVALAARPQAKSLAILGGFSAALVLLVLAVPQLTILLGDRLAGAGKGGGGRPVLANIALAKWTESPLIGHGYGSIPVLMDFDDVANTLTPLNVTDSTLVVQKRRSVHNQHITYLAELGLIGYGLLAAFCIRACRSRWARSALGLACVCALVAWSVNALTVDISNNKSFWLLLAFLEAARWRDVLMPQSSAEEPFDEFGAG